MRIACLVLLVTLAACESSSPAPRKRDDRWAPSSAQETDGEVARRDSDQRRREEERARAEAERRRQADEDARIERIIAEREKDWPEPRPVVFLKGEPAPVRTIMGTSKPKRVEQLEEAAAASEHGRGSAAAARDVPDRPARPVVAARPAREGWRPTEDPNLRADSDAFMRRIELADQKAVQAERAFESQAKLDTRGWVSGQLARIQRDPDAAHRAGVYEPSDREIQAYYVDRLMVMQASWIRSDRLQRATDAKMDALK